jgi:hypothetical protein
MMKGSAGVPPAHGSLNDRRRSGRDARTPVRRAVLAGIATLALLPAACDKPATKADILKKAEGARTKADLEKQVGKPSEVDKVGPMEQWTYKAQDGTVVFMILNDRIVFDATGGSKPR